MRKPHPRFDDARNAWVTRAGGTLKILAKGPKNSATEAAASTGDLTGHISARFLRRAEAAHRAVVLHVAVDVIGHVLVHRDVIHLPNR